MQGVLLTPLTLDHIQCTALEFKLGLKSFLSLPKICFYGTMVSLLRTMDGQGSEVGKIYSTGWGRSKAHEIRNLKVAVTTEAKLHAFSAQSSRKKKKYKT